MVKPISSVSCLPRWATRRRLERRTLGPAVAAVAARLGQPLMPWQAQVADVGLELLADGRPAYREVVFTVPRQSGKTTLILGWEVQRALGWAAMLGQPQKIAYSAQTGKDAREKLLEDQVPLLEGRRKLFGISKVTRTNGSESVLWRNGSRLVLLASGTDSGHGKTLDLGVKDELFADVDMRRDQSLNPAMATRPYAQMVTASTMGTSESLALNLAVANGRHAVDEDRGSGLAYFEWSATDADDPSDHDVWASCMPALGRTISLEVVEHAYRSLPLDEFRRAYLNIPTAADERVIPHGIWEAACDKNVEAAASVMALDVNPERSAGAIVAAGPGPVVEVVEYRPGTGWLVERVAQLFERYGVPFAIDKTGPAGSFVDALTRRGVRLVELDGKDMTRAAATFYDLVMEGEVKVRRHADLDAAVAAAEKRPVGDAWAWARKGPRHDISLLVAASMAVLVSLQSRNQLVLAAPMGGMTQSSYWRA